MKIIYCIGSLAKSGGAERVLVNKANYLADKLGYKVRILVADKSNENPAYLISNKVAVETLATPQFRASIIPGFSFFMMVKNLKPVYQEYMDVHKPDIILVLERGFEDFIIPSIKTTAIIIRESHSSMAAVKLMAENSKNRKKAFFFTWLYNRQMNKYDATVLLTERDKVDRSYLKNAYVIANAVNFIGNNRAKLTLKKVISVGRLDEYKNFKDQILLWSEIVNNFPDWILEIYGEGPERENLQSLIKELGLNEKVFLKGHSSNIEIAYAEASIFLFTSLAEGFGMVLVEAMQSGLPVVSYNAPCGPAEIIKDGDDGYIVKVGNINGLKDKISQLMNDEDKRVQMANNARFNSARFTPEKVVPSWVFLFEQLINNKRFD